MQKYIATLGGSVESERLMERIGAIRKEIIKFFARAHTYQARTYNESHCDV